MVLKFTKKGGKKVNNRKSGEKIPTSRNHRNPIIQMGSVTNRFELPDVHCNINLPTVGICVNKASIKRKKSYSKQHTSEKNRQIEMILPVKTIVRNVISDPNESSPQTIHVNIKVIFLFHRIAFTV